MYMCVNGFGRDYMILKSRHGERVQTKILPIALAEQIIICFFFFFVRIHVSRTSNHSTHVTYNQISWYGVQTKKKRV